MINKANAAMVGGGGVSVIGANTNKVQESVNLLHYPIWGNSEIYITPSTIISVFGFCVAIYGLWKTFKGKK